MASNAEIEAAPQNPFIRTENTNKPDQRDHRANLADSVAPSTRIRFSIHTGMSKRKGGSQNATAQESSPGEIRLCSSQAFENSWSTYSQFTR